MGSVIEKDRLEGGLPPPPWSTYECPVCGHRDRVELSGDMASSVQCSHCETLLEVRHRGRWTEKVPVRVVLEGPRH